jgi:hypothetical protein
MIYPTQAMFGIWVGGTEYQTNESGPGSRVNTANNLGTWVHWAATRAGGVVNLYRNGSRIFSRNDVPTGTANISAYIGGESPYWLNGYMDEARVYNRALSAAEVRQLYNWAPGPVAYWKMDEKSGTSAQDSSGNGNTGTLGTGTAAPTWSTGKYGGALNFDGSNDYVYASDSDSLITGGDQLTISVWFKADSLPGPGQSVALVEHEDTGNCSYKLWLGNFDSAGTQLFVSVRNTSDTNFERESTTTESFSTGIWYHVVGVLPGAGSKLKTYINAVDKSGWDNGVFSGTLKNADWHLNIGAAYSGGGFFDGQLDDVKIYNYARTQSQIVQDMNAGHPAPGGQIGSALAEWHFDEGYGTTANNSGFGGSSLNGTLGTGNSAPAWSLSGKYGKALSFDGSNDYVYTSNAAIIASNTVTYTSVSWGGWFNPSTGVATKTLVHKGNEFKLTTDADSKANCAIYSSSWQTAAVSSSALPLSTWSHVLCTYDGANIYVYVNGRQSGTTPAQTGAIISINSTPLNIGREPSTNYYQGLIDEVKIYPYALTSDDVKLEYNQAGAQVLGTTGVNSSYQPQAANQEYCVPGDATACAAPVARWTFDEKTGPSAFDTSGNGNTGTLGAGDSAPLWNPGKLGGALKFDGTGDYVSVNDNGSLVFNDSFTVSVWLKYNTSSTTGSYDAYIDGDAGDWGYRIKRLDDTYVFTIVDLPSPGEESVSVPISDTQWHHLDAVYTKNNSIKIYLDGILKDTTVLDGSVSIRQSSSSKTIGSWPGSSDSFNGVIDEFRVYNYARTAAQVAWDYNRGAPVAWYRFDECTGSVAHSANTPYDPTLNGTIGIGATAPQTSTGKCSSGVTSEAWNNGTTGKYGAGLSLDGADDKVTITDNANLRFDTNTQDFSLFAWVKRSATGAIHYVMSKEDADDDGWRLMVNADNTVTCSVNGVDITSTATVDTNWHLVGCTITRAGNGQVYIDGLPNGSATAISSTAMATTSNITVGTRSYTSTGYFAGLIDEAQIYNYALTAQQVKTLYNQGGAMRFGPATGTP